MVYDVEEEDEVIVGCALCPNEECGSPVITYRTVGQPISDPWDFVCSRCGIDFSLPAKDLLFQSMALETLLRNLPNVAHD